VHFDTDVLVVGAGPAGTVAARQLSMAGIRVRIVDRATFPRDKLCGDTLNPGCMAMLERLDSSVAKRIRARSRPINGMTVTGPGGASVAADYPSGLTGASLMRRDLDHWLLESAVAAGAQFDSGVSVNAPILVDDPHSPGHLGHSEHLRHPRHPQVVAGVRVLCGGREHEIRARVVIAADGRASRLATALALSRFAKSPQRWAYGAYFNGVDGLTAHGEMHIREDGYVGVAPLPEGVANVCAVRSRAHLTAGQDAGRVITQAIGADPALAERFARAQRISGVTVLGPLSVDSSAPGCPGLLLAGDAAGFVDPMTGDGLRFAIRGGELAARAALAELESGVPAFEQLRGWRIREFAGKWRVNRTLRTLVESPRALWWAAGAARAWPAPVTHLIGVAGDVALARHTFRLKAEATEAKAAAAEERRPA
jgi:flavin-dependent dehydrogenase